MCLSLPSITLDPCAGKEHGHENKDLFHVTKFQIVDCHELIPEGHSSSDKMLVPKGNRIWFPIVRRIGDVWLDRFL